MGNYSGRVAAQLSVHLRRQHVPSGKEEQKLFIVGQMFSLPSAFTMGSDTDFDGPGSLCRTRSGKVTINDDCQFIIKPSATCLGFFFFINH